MSEFGNLKIGTGAQKGVGQFPIKDRAGDLNQVSGSSKSFIDTLQETIGEANESLKAADRAAENFAAGKSGDLHDLMLTMEKAEMSLRTVNAVRNKMVEAYQEIMRMQV